MTVRLSSRCLDILSLLVATEHPLAAVELGDQLNISARMVRTSLVPAEQWLRNKNITLKQVPGRGYSLVGLAESKRNLAEKIRTYDQPVLWLPPSERIYVLLLTLFFADRPTQIKQLQQTLNLSRTTTLTVLDEGEKWLHRHGLQLIRRQNFGCMVIGDECNWREAVVALLQESAGDARLLALLQGSNTVVDLSCRTRTGLEEVLARVWLQLNIPLIRQSISPLKQEFDGTLSDQAYIEACLYLAIAAYRNRIGRSLTTAPNGSKSPWLAEQMATAQKLAVRLYQQAGIRFSEAEIGWIAVHFAGTSPLSHTPDASGTTIEAGDDPTIRRIVDRIVAQASLSLHPSLSADQDLIRNLTLRLGTLLEPEHSLREQSPRKSLLRELQAQFPFVYSVARQSSPYLTEQIGREISEAEIGDIAVCLIAAMERLRQSDRLRKRLLVVCSEGAVTAWLLVSRLRAEFPDVEIAEVISAFELEGGKHLDGIDIIVSTIPLRIKNIPARQVNPLLTAEDCRGLRELLERKQALAPSNGSADPSTIHLADVLTPQMIGLGVDAENWRDVVDKAGSKLLQEGFIESRFVQAMKDIIITYGPYMVIWPGTVLLHAPPHGVRQLGMELISLRRPVHFGHAQNDPVQVAIVLAARDNHSHIVALQELNRMMQNEEARSAIRGTVHKSVVLHWITQYSNSMEL